MLSATPLVDHMWASKLINSCGLCSIIIYGWMCERAELLCIAERKRERGEMLPAGSLEEGLHGRRLQCMQCRSSSHARESFDFDGDQEMKLKLKCIQEPERVLLGVAYESQ